jgi:hypothetical protein
MISTAHLIGTLSYQFDGTELEGNYQVCVGVQQSRFSTQSCVTFAFAP